MEYLYEGIESECTYFLCFCFFYLLEKMPGRRDSKTSREAGGNLAFSKENTDMVSYEDLLIAQYLDELRKTKNSMKKQRE